MQTWKDSKYFLSIFLGFSLVDVLFIVIMQDYLNIYFLETFVFGFSFLLIGFVIAYAVQAKKDRERNND